jgi:hypothetical protein
VGTDPHQVLPGIEAKPVKYIFQETLYYIRQPHQDYRYSGGPEHKNYGLFRRRSIVFEMERLYFTFVHGFSRHEKK